MENKKIGFFSRIKLAIIKFDAYSIFAEEKLAKSISYFIRLLLIFTFLISTVFTIMYNNNLKDTITFFDSKIPDFHFNEYKLDVDTDKPIVIENEEIFTGYIVIDDINNSESEQVEEYKEKVILYNNGVILLSESLLVLNQMSGEFTTFTYESLKDNVDFNNLNKQSIIDFFSNNELLIWSVVFISVFIALFITYIVLKVIDLAILSVLGYFLTKIYKLKMQYKEVLKMSMYALTLPIILECIYLVINNITGFEIKYFSIMYNAIAFIYLITAILMIKTDLIKQQIEVQAIVDKQKEVKEEQENPDKQEKKEDKKEKEEKNKKEKKDNEKGEAPEGSKA